MTNTQHVNIKNLFPELEKVSQAATSTGHLQTAVTTLHRVKGKLDYEVRSLSVKRSKPRKQSELSPEPNPFLPYDPAMYVTHLESGHIILLNKFNVVPGHYLIVTPAFETQETPLQLKEFRAISEVLPAFKQLIFYNSGKNAGASQPHRHLQSLPVENLPIDSALISLPETPEQLPTLPYQHLICRLTTAEPEKLYSLYKQMLDSLGLSKEPQNLKPYNLLMTREWLMIVPRNQGRYGNMSINALGFAGLLLVKDEQMLEELIAVDPDRVLKAVSSS